MADGANYTNPDDKSRLENLKRWKLQELKRLEEDGDGQPGGIEDYERRKREFMDKIDSKFNKKS